MSIRRFTAGFSPLFFGNNLNICRVVARRAQRTPTYTFTEIYLLCTFSPFAASLALFSRTHTCTHMVSESVQKTFIHHTKCFCVSPKNRDSLLQLRAVSDSSELNIENNAFIWSATRSVFYKHIQQQCSSRWNLTCAPSGRHRWK